MIQKQLLIITKKQCKREERKGGKEKREKKRKIFFFLTPWRKYWLLFTSKKNIGIHIEERKSEKLRDVDEE